VKSRFSSSPWSRSILRIAMSTAPADAVRGEDLALEVLDLADRRFDKHRVLAFV